MTNLQNQTNARCVMELEKQSGRGWRSARGFPRGRLEGAAAQEKITRN